MMLLFAFAAGLHAAADDNKPDAGKKNQWTPADVVYQEDAGQFRISPDGKFALWVKGSADKDKDLRVGNLYLSNLSDGKAVQLTRGTDDISNPRWSPSGEMIAISEQPRAAEAQAGYRIHATLADGERRRRALARDGIRARHQTIRMAERRHYSFQRRRRFLSVRAANEGAQRRFECGG